METMATSVQARQDTLARTGSHWTCGCAFLESFSQTGRKAPHQPARYLSRPFARTHPHAQQGMLPPRGRDARVEASCGEAACCW